MAFGLFLFARPQIVDWLNDRTNLRAAKEAAERGWDRGLKSYPQLRRGMRIFLPSFVIIMGIVVMLGGFF